MKCECKLFRPLVGCLGGLVLFCLLLTALPAQAGKADCLRLKDKVEDYEYFLSYCGQPKNANQPDCINSPREKAGKAALEKWKAGNCEGKTDAQASLRCSDLEKELNEWMRWVENCRVNERDGAPLGLSCPDVRKKTAEASKKLDDNQCLAPQKLPKKSQ